MNEAESERFAKMRIALELVLQFHTGHWTQEAQDAWERNMDMVLGPCNLRPRERSPYHEIPATNEATTRNLCNAVREALK